jgi:hypothetical protein
MMSREREKEISREKSTKKARKKDEEKFSRECHDCYE